MAPRFGMRGLLAYVAVWAIAAAFHMFAEGTCAFVHVVALALMALSAVMACILSNNEHGRRWIAVAWALPISVIVSAFVVLLIPNMLAFVSFGGETHIRRMSYTSYRIRIGTRQFDPQGARNINYYRWWSKDSGSTQMAMRIRRDDYEAMLQKYRCSAFPPLMVDRYVGPDAEATKVDRVGEFLHRIANDGGGPTWWRPPIARDDVECNLLREEQVDGSSGYIKSVWIYDADSETLWVFE
jgi:hypothetical protein